MFRINWINILQPKKETKLCVFQFPWTENSALPTESDTQEPNESNSAPWFLLFGCLFSRSVSRFLAFNFGAHWPNPKSKLVCLKTYCKIVLPAAMPVRKSDWDSMKKKLKHRNLQFRNSTAATEKKPFKSKEIPDNWWQLTANVTFRNILFDFHCISITFLSYKLVFATRISN